MFVFLDCELFMSTLLFCIVIFICMINVKNKKYNTSLINLNFIVDLLVKVAQKFKAT